MDKIEQNYFTSGNVLYASELNTIVDKINGLIDGYDSQLNDDVQHQIDLLNDAIDELNNTANEEKDRLDGVINDIDNTVRDKVDAMFEDSQFLDELKEGIQSASNFGDSDVDRYLQQIGIINRQGDEVTYAWSTLELTVNSLSGSVNNLINNGIDYTAVQAAVNATVEDAVASLDLSTMYARKNAETIIEWMYSALKQSTSADKTYNEIVSAGKNGLSSAISELRTYVEKLKNGDYVATASLEAKVDDAIAGLKASAGSNNAKTEIFNKISKNSDDISGIVTSITGDSSNAAITTKIGLWKAGLITESNLSNKASSAGLVAANDFTSANIIAKINESGSSALISADKVDINASNLTIDAANVVINGETLASGNATITGNINAKSLSLTDGLGINNGCVKITSQNSQNGGVGKIEIDATGGDYNDNEISISNQSGLEVTTYGGVFKVGKESGSSNKLAITTSDGSSSGTGYSGVINGARFINGICVGPA